MAVKYIPKDMRCRNCGRKLGRFILPPGGYVEIRCTRSTCQRASVERGNMGQLAQLIRGLNGDTPPEVWEAMRVALNSTAGAGAEQGKIVKIKN